MSRTWRMTRVLPRSWVPYTFDPDLRAEKVAHDVAVAIAQDPTLLDLREMMIDSVSAMSINAELRGVESGAIRFGLRPEGRRFRKRLALYEGFLETRIIDRDDRPATEDLDEIEGFMRGGRRFDTIEPTVARLALPVGELVRVDGVMAVADRDPDVHHDDLAGSGDRVISESLVRYAEFWAPVADSDAIVCMSFRTPNFAAADYLLDEVLTIAESLRIEWDGD